MSEDSISYGEDKENLLYISKKINVDEFGLGEEGPFRESLSSCESNLSVKAIGSEVKFLEDIFAVGQITNDPQVARRFKPFHLRWSFGMNSKTGLINITNDSRKEVFFSSVHSAVLYNYCTREMRHLEGHQDIITCISSDASGDWLVSSDSDKDGCLIVWSSKDLLPVYTLFNKYPESGILLMAISPCARYLLTIGEAYDYYTIDFWLWTLGPENPNDTLIVQKAHGTPVKICFSPDIEEHIMLVFQQDVFLIVWDTVNNKILPFVIPQITNKDKIGELSCGTYMKECHECYASSTRGCILVFRNTLYGRNFEDAELNNSKMYINAVKVTPASIDVITTTEGILVVGDSRGHILFFDKMVRILYWIRNIATGAITGISFSLSPKLYQYENSKIIVKGITIYWNGDKYFLCCLNKFPVINSLKLDTFGYGLLTFIIFCVCIFLITTMTRKKVTDERPRYFVSEIFVERRLDDDIIIGCEYQDMQDEITKLIDAPFDASLDYKPFTVRDFFLSTTDCNIYAFDFIHNSCSPLFQVADANISCIDAHVEMPYIVIGYENGRIVLLDFEKKDQISSYLLPKTEETTEGDSVTCIKFSSESLHLICGRQNGEVWVLEPVILRPKSSTPFRYSHSKIVKIEFSSNSLQFAYFDANKTVMLFNYSPVENCWKFRGKVRSHYEQITDIRFFSCYKTKTSILYTIGVDRYLVEYNNSDIRNDDEENVFNVASRERIEQSAIPMNFTYYEKKLGSRIIGYFLLADDKHKIKTLHAASKVPRSLVLGPSFGCFKDSYVKKMRVTKISQAGKNCNFTTLFNTLGSVLPQQNSRYLIFISDRHLGINILPLDGNPYKCTGYLAHPKKVADFALSYNGLYVFTYGVDDRCILQWEVKPRSVELLAIMGGTELEPYYCLLEGGKNGWLFQEIQDLFFYMQIVQQENIDLPRRVSDCINLSEIPELVRTCGYYPSNFELETMMIDIRYREFDETEVVRDEISFVDFVKLFINHRPVYGYSLDQIKENFKTICAMADYPRKGRIESHDFIYLLQTIGEPTPKLHTNLTTLLRTISYGENNYEFLPGEIDTNFLLYELLGIDPDRTESQEYENASNASDSQNY